MRWLDPDLWRERYTARVNEFRNGEISASLFRAHLKTMGFMARAIEDEVSLHWTERSKK